MQLMTAILQKYNPTKDHYSYAQLSGRFVFEEIETISFNITGPFKEFFFINQHPSSNSDDAMTKSVGFFVKN